MDPNTAAEWCKEQNGQLGLSVVMDIPDDKWTEEQIRQAVTTLAPDQKVFVIDTKINQEVSHTYALLEWKKGVPNCFQGDSIQLTGEVKARLFPLVTSASCLEGPSQTMSDTVEVTTTSVPTTNYPPASFFMDIGKLVESVVKISSPSVNYGYRKLRIFSGVQPVPPGEEEYETWMEQALQALEEWDVPEAQKKQRITESLKGVAAEAIRNLKFSQESCTAYDYLRMLQDEFGRTEKATDLIFLFEHTFQRENEQLSEYIRRLNKMLYQIVLKKGIEPRDMDQVRMKQILRGALSSDPIWIQLKTLQGGTSLRYSDLIKMVREEEAILEEKKKGSGFSFPAEVRTLNVSNGNSEIEELKAQVSQLTKMLTLLSAGVKSPLGKVTSEPVPESTTRVVPIQKPSNICYNCGGVGHYRKTCPSPSKNRGSYLPAENYRGPQ